jgi:hypothetical protein
VDEPVVVPPVPITQTQATKVRGVWKGYIEEFHMGSDDTITITIAVGEDGVISGQLVQGSGPPPTAATPEDRVWPASVETITPVLPTVVAGFPYTVRNPRVEAERLRFSYVQSEPWQGWCALQDSFEVEPGSFACSPHYDSCVGRQSDCLIANAMCSPFTGPCSCHADGCTARADVYGGYPFDLGFNDDVATGRTPWGTVHLIRSSP